MVLFIGGSFEDGNKTSSLPKRVEFLEQLKHCSFLWRTLLRWIR